MDRVELEHRYKDAVVRPDYIISSMQRKIESISHLRSGRQLEPAQVLAELPIVPGKRRGNFEHSSIVFEQRRDIFLPCFHVNAGLRQLATARQSDSKQTAAEFREQHHRWSFLLCSHLGRPSWHR